MSQGTDALLQQVLGISRELALLAESGDAAAAVALDAERRELLRALRASGATLGHDARALLDDVAAMNDRALGLLEHRLRIKARELDLAMTGRRAVRAYAATG